MSDVYKVILFCAFNGMLTDAVVFSLIDREIKLLLFLPQFSCVFYSKYLTYIIGKHFWISLMLCRTTAHFHEKNAAISLVVRLECLTKLQEEMILSIKLWSIYATISFYLHAAGAFTEYHTIS